MTRSRKIASIPIAAVKPPNSRKRNRVRFDELVQSVATVGLKRPVTVSRRGSGYDLVCGERRLDAVAALGEVEIPAILTQASPEDCILMGLVENIARWRHSSAELVDDISRQCRRHSVSEVAATLGLKEDLVRAIVYLLKHGERRLVSAVERGVVPPTLAVEIARAESPELQGALLEAYISDRHTSTQIGRMRKLLEQRHREQMKAQVGGVTVDSKALVRAYRQETERQQLLARKADLTQGRLAFIVGALKTLLGERMFATLLHREGFDRVPLTIMRRISTGTARPS